MFAKKVIERLKNSREPLSVSNLYLLSGLSRRELGLLSEAWPEIPPERRRSVLRSLVEIAEASFEADFGDVFRFCLKDEDGEVRAEAIEGLWEDESPSLLRVLLSILRDDPSPLVRAEAAEALGRFVLKGEMEELDSALWSGLRASLLSVIHAQGEELEVRRRAVEAISYCGDDEVRRIIEMAYSHPAQKMRASAVFAMGRSLDPVWKDALLEELKDSDSEMRYEAARACGEMELKEALPHLVRLVKDRDREVQEAAIWALGQVGGREAKRVLQACRDKDELLAEAADEALSEMEFSEGVIDIPIDESEG